MTVAFTFLTVSLFAWYAIRPTLSTILYLKREIADKVEVNQKMEEKISALIEAQGVLSQIEPNLPYLSEALPQQADVVTLFGQLATLAQISQASISSVRTSDVPLGSIASPSATRNTGNPSQLPLSVTVTGTYDKLQLFLDGMIDMRRIVSIDSIGFSPDKTSGSLLDNSVLQLLIKARSFYIPESNNGQ